MTGSANRELDAAQPEEVLWRCLDALPTQPELQIATMLSLSVGAAHSYEARSMLWSTFRVLRPASIIETGTNHGLTSAYMWALGEAVGRAPTIRTFDICASTLAPRLWERVGAHGAITLFKGDSGQMVAQSCQPGADFVLIDGDHSYSGAERDWRAAEPFLAPRCVILCDNMEHPGGCGEFFRTLKPLWFHPQLAMLVRGFSPAETETLFSTYQQRLLPLWLAAASGMQAAEMRERVRVLRENLASGVQDEVAGSNVADLCRELSSLARNSREPRYSDLMAISAEHGIGTLAEARRTRIRESMPAWLFSLVYPAYRLLRPRRGPSDA